MNFTSIKSRLQTFARSAMGIDGVLDHFNRMRNGGAYQRPTRAYRQVAPVRAAVDAKATRLASMPVRVSTAADQIIESGPVVELLAQPNERMTGREFWTTSCALLDLTGECHWVYLDVLGDPFSGRPTQIMPIGAWQMLPAIAGDGKLIGWWYTPYGYGGKPAFIAPDQVHTIINRPYDYDRPYRGVAALESAGAVVSQVWKADIANEKALDNGVEPGGAFTFAAQPTPGQLKDFRQELEDRYSGVHNRSRPLVTWGGLKYEAVARAFSDMEFSVLKKMSIVDICAALGVDPAAIGYYEDSNFAHADAAKASLWLDTVIPLGCRLAEEFQRGPLARFANDNSISHTYAKRDARAIRQSEKFSLGYRTAKSQPKPGSNLFLWFDDSHVAAVQKMQLDQAQAASIYIDKFLSPAGDVIESMDLPLPVHPWQKTAYIPIGMVDIQGGGYDPNDPSGSGSPEPDGDEKPVKPADSQPADDQIQDSDDDGPAGGSGTVQAGFDFEKLPSEYRAISQAHLQSIWESWRASWAGIQKQFESKITKHQHELRREVLKRLEALPQEKSIVRKDVLGTVLFDLTDAKGKLLASVRPLVRLAARFGGEQAMTEAAQAKGQEKASPFNISDPEVITAMRKREIRIAETDATLRRRLADELADGVNNGESIGELVSRVKHEFNMSNIRAATIARTEVGGAVEDARQVGRAQAGTPMKSWLWSRRETGRPWHMQTEAITLAKPVANHSLFTLAKTGAQTMYPRGSGLTAEDAANCGCTTLARYEGDSIKSVIDRYIQRGFLTVEKLHTLDIQRNSAA